MIIFNSFIVPFWSSKTLPNMDNKLDTITQQTKIQINLKGS
jgi:hypothetical protein